MVTINLEDKSTLIVGGSQGIGAAIARMCAQAGSRIAWTDLQPSPEQEKLLKELGAVTLYRSVDCTDPDATKNFVNVVIDTWGKIDNLVYCAGFTSPVPFLSLTADEWRHVVDINLNGAFYATHAVLPHMKNIGQGCIVLIGSAAIVAGGGGRADYASAKAGLEGLNRAICKEFGPYGIRCNLVHPSLIETELLKKRHPDPQKRLSLAESVPLKRLGKPEDVAAVVCFLLSDLASYISGQSIFVDGGRTFCK